MRKTLHIIKSALLTLAVAVSATSCLNKYPDSAILEENALQNYNDAEQHLTGIYSSLLSSNLYSGLLTLLPDIQSDFVYALDGFSNTYGNFWQWDIRPTASELESVYGSLYSVIGNCNFLLDRIDPIIAAQTDETKIDNLQDYKGQAYAVRALCYLELAKCFCKAYDPATASTEKGVVLRTKYFESEPMVRASLEATYAQILDDLTLAEELIFDEEEYNGPNAAYMTQAAVFAIRARAALYMQDWDGAIEYSSKVIDENGNFALASVNTYYSTSIGTVDEYFYMWNYDESNEVIFKLKYTTSAYGGALGQLFLGFNVDYTYFYPDYVPAKWVLNLYNSSDARYNSLFAGSDSGITIGRPYGMSWPLLVKYYGNRTLMSTSLAFVHSSMPKVLRLSEQYLIRAEAYCRKGNYSKASDDLSTLRKARFDVGAGAIAVNESNWLQNISDERVRELYMEGFRLHDLKRWGKGFERTWQTNALDEGASLKVEDDNPLFVWPIPQHELDVPGSGIEPNESNR